MSAGERAQYKRQRPLLTDYRVLSPSSSSSAISVVDLEKETPLASGGGFGGPVDPRRAGPALGFFTGTSRSSSVLALAWILLDGIPELTSTSGAVATVGS